ncbi:MAG: chalcone isomerase family protein [Gammaproteobacteria bacterium]|nr:chalcone isomerase family protein [Gammaproteobacteria bacterium]
MTGLMFLFLAGTSMADETSTVIADVSIDNSVQTASGSALVLNGAGIRKKAFFKVYIGALYVKERSQDAGKILSADMENRVLMHFLYKEVSASKLTDAWHDGFSANLPENDYKTMKPRIDQLAAMFPAMKTGDRAVLEYSPDTGTTVTINGQSRGSIAGADFNRALLSVWIGEKPITGSLKAAMLGGK